MVQEALAGNNELRGQQRNLDKTGEMQAKRFDSSKRVDLILREESGYSKPRFDRKHKRD